MSNVLGDDKRHQIVALGRLGWSLRRIEQATGVRRETISGYLKAAGIAVRGPGRRSEAKPKPAISPPKVSTDLRPRNPAISSEVSNDSEPPKPAMSSGVSTDLAAVRPGRAPSASACEPYRELITEALARGRNAMAIWQDLVDGHGFQARYASVRRFVVALRGRTPTEARAIITTAPGDDYGESPLYGERPGSSLFIDERQPKTVGCRNHERLQLGNLIVLAEDAAQVAPREKYRARASHPAQWPFFAEVRAEAMDHGAYTRSAHRAFPTDETVHTAVPCAQITGSEMRRRVPGPVGQLPTERASCRRVQRRIDRRVVN